MNFAERMKKARENRTSKEDRDQFIEKIIMSVPDKLKSYYLRVPRAYAIKMISSFNNRNSMRKAIDCKCLECSNFSRQEIIDCSIRQCALYNFRPYTDKSKNDDDEIE